MRTLFLRKPANKGRFTSKTDAMNRSERIWVCVHCQAWHKEKVKTCSQCISTEILYFASTIEARRYAELSLQQHHGIISNLTVKPRYPIVVQGIAIRVYEADFEYTRNGAEVVED